MVQSIEQPTVSIIIHMHEGVLYIVSALVIGTECNSSLLDGITVESVAVYSDSIYNTTELEPEWMESMMTPATEPTDWLLTTYPSNFLKSVEIVLYSTQKILEMVG